MANRFGLFVLASISDGFTRYSATDSYSTQNSNVNFAILFLDLDGNILEIESYDTDDVANDLGAPHPQKLIIGIQDKHAPLYGLISTRDDGTTNQGGGIYITQPTDQQALFVSGSSLIACSALSNCLR